jgi:hypothetical protein
MSFTIYQLHIISSNGNFIELFLNTLYINGFSLHRQAQHRFWSEKEYPAVLLQGLSNQK